MLTELGREFRFQQQYPIKDKRGFNWYWDLYYFVKGKNPYGGIHVVIDVNGRIHDFQKEYSGPGGGYTRDYDKHWSYVNARRHGWECLYYTNEDCSRKGEKLRETSYSLVADLITMADYWM